MSIEHKYKKYKTKYLNLKNVMSGGLLEGAEAEVVKQTEEIVKLTSEIVKLQQKIDSVAANCGATKSTDLQSTIKQFTTLLKANMGIPTFTGQARMTGMPSFPRRVQMTGMPSFPGRAQMTAIPIPQRISGTPFSPKITTGYMPGMVI